MYALYIHERFGGEIIHVDALLPNGETIPHYFNYIKGVNFDFSGSQFRGATQFLNRRSETREAVLSLPDGERERYALFRERIQKSRAVD